MLTEIISRPPDMTDSLDSQSGPGDL